MYGSKTWRYGGGGETLFTRRGSEEGKGRVKNLCVGGWAIPWLWPATAVLLSLTVLDFHKNHRIGHAQGST